MVFFEYVIDAVKGWPAAARTFEVEKCPPDSAAPFRDAFDRLAKQNGAPTLNTADRVITTTDITVSYFRGAGIVTTAETRNVQVRVELLGPHLAMSSWWLGEYCLVTTAALAGINRVREVEILKSLKDKVATQQSRTSEESYSDFDFRTLGERPLHLVVAWAFKRTSPEYVETSAAQRCLNKVIPCFCAAFLGAPGPQPV